MPNSIEVTDLIGRPYVRCSDDPRVGLDCFGVCVVVYQRGGKSAPLLTPAIVGEKSLDAVRDVGRLSTPNVEPWELLGADLACAKELLDVVRLRGTDAAGGIATLVSVSPQLFITATPERGVILRRASAFAGSVLGVYRQRKT